MDDKLESLDNLSLRAKCKEYGLPNIPVTDSSRQVLIRKLRSCMEKSNTKSAVEKGRNSYIPKTVSGGTSAKNSRNVSKNERLSMSISKGNNGFLKENPIIVSAPIENVKPQKKKLFRHTENFDLKGLNKISSNFDVQNLNNRNEDRDYILGSEASDKNKCSNSQVDQYLDYPQERVVNSHGIIPSISDQGYNSGIHIRHSTTFKPNVDQKDGVISTAYLSDFARSLERLKNEPLRLSSQTSRLLSRKSESEWPHYETATTIKPGYNSAVGHIFKTFLTNLERKYHLKLNLIIVFSLLLAVFIYIFFFM